MTINHVLFGPEPLRHGSLRAHAWPRTLLLVLGGIFLLVANAFSAPTGGAPAADASELGQEPLSLTPYFAVLEDPSLALTLADVQKADLAGAFKTESPSGEALSFGFTHSAYWLRLTLRNTSDIPLERMLEIAFARLSSVQFHQPNGAGAYQSLTTGRLTPFATRPYRNRFFVFPVTLPAHSDQVVYLRLQSTDGIVVPAKLWAPQAFHAYERNDYLSQALYFGMAIAMVLFNLLLFVALRDVIYLLYVSFVTCSVLTIAAQNGLAQEFLWPQATVWSNISTFVGFSLSIASLLLFTRNMLTTWSVIPKVDRLIKVLVGVQLLAPIGFAFSLQVLARPAALANFAMGMLVLGVGLFCAFKRQRSAYFFVAAFVMILIGGAMTALRSFGLLPSNVLTMNGLQFGSAVEMLLLAFALADRFNTIRRDTARAQRQALAAQQLLVENLRTSERVLEKRVAARTDELQILNHQLEALSTTDGLTGIANRRRFDEALASEWNRAARLGQPLALAMLDVDWFKNYNDHYGHQAGDECLRRIARALADTVCRGGDLVARYGGEEFVFIAPNSDAVSALNIARKVCEAIQRLALPHAGSVFGCVTVSVGVTAMVPEEGDASEMLVKRADEGLYRAKEQGRNRAIPSGQAGPA